ncbi:MAG: hypothetical protein WC551_08920 [Patescibacteria group bacterium]
MTMTPEHFVANIGAEIRAAFENDPEAMERAIETLGRVLAGLCRDFRPVDLPEPFDVFAECRRIRDTEGALRAGLYYQRAMGCSAAVAMVTVRSMP